MAGTKLFMGVSYLHPPNMNPSKSKSEAHIYLMGGSAQILISMMFSLFPLSMISLQTRALILTANRGKTISEHHSCALASAVPKKLKQYAKSMNVSQTAMPPSFSLPKVEYQD